MFCLIHILFTCTANKEKAVTIINADAHYLAPMVYYHVHTPESLPAPQLDKYLAAGWFRMQQLIFTTDLITKDDKLIPVFWLRLAVKKYIPSKTHRKIMAANKNYTISCGPLVITRELEQLYTQYRQAMDFELAASIQDSLLGEAVTSIYDTQCITVRDGQTLIAAGFFDKGESSMAGILNIYHPGYSTKQLGKYLMMLKIEYARRNQKKYFYTGYISTAYSKFDYKLMVGSAATEVYNRQQDIWIQWTEVDKEILEQWLEERN